MDEIYVYILRTVLAIVALVGVVWSGLRYVIKYHSLRTSHEGREYTDNKIASLISKIQELEAELYDLNIALSGHSERLGFLEKMGAELSGFKERLLVLEKTRKAAKKK